MGPRQLVVLGDSGVLGWGDRDCGGWCQRLRMEWMQLPLAPVIYPLGVRGDGLERVATRWRQEWNCRGELRRQQPDGLLLSVGLNDTARVGRIDGRPQLDVEAFAFGIGQLLAEMTSVTSVFVLGITAVDEHVMPFADCLWYSNAQIHATEAALAERCQEADVPFLAIHEAMQAEQEWLRWMEADGIHLNANGHTWIYHAVRRWNPLLQWAGFHALNMQIPNQYIEPGC
ncbi:GDSL-type esterase/lipase family protein [Synechococcus sp. M16CYN]|uniref:GDSL-type esterase/lipase family protein n=1 Tax=Synechococcus sp. M16CYN TaxID=3103139 RepID=UPI0032518F9F